VSGGVTPTAAIRTLAIGPGAIAVRLATTRDVRAGRAVRIVRGGRARAVHLPELSPEETAGYLRWYVAKYPGQGRRYLGLKEPTGTLEEAQALTPRTPVFLIKDA